MLYRITRTLPGTMPGIGAATLCYGETADPRHPSHKFEIYLGIAPRNVVYGINALVTRVEDERGVTIATPAPDGANGDRPWSETHTALINQEMRIVESRIQFYDERKQLDDEGRDARDFYRRMLKRLDVLSRDGG